MAEQHRHLTRPKRPIAEILENHPEPLTQRQMGELLTKPQQTISRWLRGTTRMPEWARDLLELFHGPTNHELTLPEREQRARTLLNIAIRRTRDTLAKAIEEFENVMLAVDEEHQAWLLVQKFMLESKGLPFDPDAYDIRGESEAPSVEHEDDTRD